MIELRGIAIALTIGVVIGSVGAWINRGVMCERDMLQLKGTFEKAVEAAKDEARADEQRLQRNANKIAEEARKDVEIIDRNAAVVGGSTVSLQHAATEYAATQVCDPGVARRGAAATSAAMVLSELFGECVATAARVAKEADVSRAAGTACERFGDSLNQPSSQ